MHKLLAATRLVAGDQMQSSRLTYWIAKKISQLQKKIKNY